MYLIRHLRGFFNVSHGNCVKLLLSCKMVSIEFMNCLIFIKLYTFLIFRNSGTLALLPLTIDRLVAVTFPLRHAYVITTKSSLSLIFLCWLPLVALLLYDTIEYKIGAIAVSSQWRISNQCIAKYLVQSK